MTSITAAFSAFLRWNRRFCPTIGFLPIVTRTASHERRRRVEDLVEWLMGNLLLPLVAPRRRFDQLMDRKQERERAAADAKRRLEELVAYLVIAEKVTGALEVLSDRLFKDLLHVVEEKATIALQEVLDQPLRRGPAPS